MTFEDRVAHFKTALGSKSALRKDASAPASESAMAAIEKLTATVTPRAAVPAE